MLVEVKKMCPNMSILEIENTTLAELEVIRKAYELQRLDNEYFATLMAWQNAIVKSTSKNGKPKYQKFNQIFDYEKKYKEIMNLNKKVDKKMLQLLCRANNRG